MPSSPARSRRSRGVLQRRVGHYSAAQLRVTSAATDLFTMHGVAGTSLQMIADAMGVTKAAVYHQFSTKESIVLACTEIQLAAVERHLDEAEASEDYERSRRDMLAFVVNLAVARRRTVATLQNDPSIARLLAEHPPFRRVQMRLRQFMQGATVTNASQVQSAMVFAALTGAVAHPLVADLSDEALRRELTQLIERVLQIPKGTSGSNR